MLLRRNGDENSKYQAKNYKGMISELSSHSICFCGFPL